MAGVVKRGGEGKMMNDTSGRLMEVLALAGAGVALGAIAAKRRRSGYGFRGRVVVVTGGSRGLGLVMARQLVRAGARVALLARDEEDLERAVRGAHGMAGQPQAMPRRAMGVGCDVTDEGAVRAAVRRVAERWGRIDAVVNNAGQILVGPMQHATTGDLERLLAVHVLGPWHVTRAAMPWLEHAPGGGRVLNVSSIGGLLAVPHLLAYSASKHALVGLSNAMRSELAGRNVWVTTACPGLMRTGSPRNARVKGRHEAEYAWFAIGDSLPLISMNAERAAGQMLDAMRRGQARVVVGLPAKAAAMTHALLPGLTAKMNELVAATLPGAAGSDGDEARRGYESESAWVPSVLTTLTQRAARRNNEL